MSSAAAECVRATDLWSAYRPSESVPWDVRRVVHLHRRAGFAATWHEVQRDLAAGPRAAVDRMVRGDACTVGVPDEFQTLARLIGDAAVAAHSANRLKAWWHFRMLFSPNPLTERLTLMWHNHFATSNLKVNDVAAMRRQNDIFRDYARAPFGELLRRAVQNPAMLVWLDAQANRKEHPNENLAREIMELFTLGVGHYSERDVKEAARALTGWTIKGGAFRDFDPYHDAGDKTILGRKGRWRGDDLVRLLVDHPATARRLAARICELFMGEGAADASAVTALADGLRERDLDIGWAVDTVLRSDRFFADANIGSRVRGPVEFVVGSVRALELLDPPPSTLLLSEWTANLGQDLFYPPNVFGWPGGRAWLTGRTVLGRARFAHALVDGTLDDRLAPPQLSDLLQRHGGDPGGAMEFFAELVLGAVSESTRDRIDAARNGRDDPAALRRFVATLLASPEAQLA